MFNAISRREFLRSTAAATAVAGVSRVRADSPNERVRMAFIGTGGRGGANMHELLNRQKEIGIDVVALCDVNSRNLAKAAERHPSARTHADFRELYEKTDDFDAVVVSTTEHTHAYATMPALRSGKHVYCEKPLTHNVAESRLIMDAAAEVKVATQMGTQIHGRPNYRRVVELIQSGAIGGVTEVHVWVGRAWGRQTRAEHDRHGDRVFVTERPKKAMAPPEYLNWDLWIGPAPYRPYHEVYFPGPKWYRWWDFGNGTMSDLGSHWNDLPFWALKLDAPRTIEAFGPEPHPEIAPASMSAVYEYGPRGDMPACTLTWYQGAMKPKIWQEAGIPQWNSGVLFVGEKGMLLSDYGKHTLLPEENFKDFKAPEPFLPQSPGHHLQWLRAVVNGTPTGSPFSYAGPLTEANHLGNVAYRAGTKLQWDSRNLRVTNTRAADQFLGREPRKGWSL